MKALASDDSSIDKSGRRSPVFVYAQILFFICYATFMYVVYGSIVRWAYRRAQKEGRTFYVDRLPSGKK